MNLSSASDASLWQLAVIGRNQEACRELVGRHHPFVRGVCGQLLLCADDVEEACQVTFLTLLENGDAIRGDDFSAWLYRVAWRASLRVRSDTRRATPQGRESLPELTATDAFARIEDAERGQQVCSAVDCLPERYRDVLVLHYVKGLAREQVARRLQISVQAVKGRLARGRDLLRSRLLKKGISLAAVAAVFSRQADACVEERQQQLMEAAICHWMDGAPVSIARIQLTDLTRKDFGMFTSKGIASKLTATGLLLAALCIAFVVGRMTPAGGSTGTVPVLESQLQGGPLVTAQPAAFDNLVEPAFDELAEAPIVLVSAQESQPALQRPATPQPVLPQPAPLAQPGLPQPAAQPAFPQPAVTQPALPQPAVRPAQFPNRVAVQNNPFQQVNPIAQISNSSVSLQNQPRAGLPEGKWVRNAPLGKVISEVDGALITLTLSLATIPGVQFSVKAEHSVASDGTIYGIVHGVDVDAPAVTDEMQELAMLSMLSDMPFLLRVHSDEDSVTIKGVTVGPPAALGSEAADMDVMQIVRMAIGGTFHREQ